MTCLGFEEVLVGVFWLEEAVESGWAVVVSDAGITKEKRNKEFATVKGSKKCD